MEHAIVHACRLHVVCCFVLLSALLCPDGSFSMLPASCSHHAHTRPRHANMRSARSLSTAAGNWGCVKRRCAARALSCASATRLCCSATRCRAASCASCGGCKTCRCPSFRCWFRAWRAATGPPTLVAARAAVVVQAAAAAQQPRTCTLSGPNCMRWSGAGRAPPALMTRAPSPCRRRTTRAAARALVAAVRRGRMEDARALALTARTTTTGAEAGSRAS
eukprot:362321-Chlamydomonas_euryale.AAC.3